MLVLTILIFAATALLVIALFELDNRYWKRRLTNWAESHHLQLVSFRGVSLWEGPTAFLNRSRNQRLFRVVIKDRNGLTRYCWIMFGTFWGFTSGPVMRVEWDNADG
jgi:hypothetical protein